MNQSGWSTWAVTLLGALLVSCDAGQDCTDIGCANLVSITAKPKASLWQEGEYELEVTYDGVTARCGFTLPQELPTARVSTLLNCGSVVHPSLYATGDCSQNCSLSSPFELNLSIDAQPAEVTLQLTREGEVVLSDERSVEYRELYPNGVECGGPHCSQARYALTFTFEEP